MKSILLAALGLLSQSCFVTAAPLTQTDTPLPPDSSQTLMTALLADPNANNTDQFSAIAKRDYGVMANDLNGPCRAVTIIFARGTFELGNVGLLAGPPFFDRLGALIGSGNLAVQGVPYPANVVGYLKGGDPAGIQTFAQLAEQAASQCPDTQLVLSGYSQGAQLVHRGGALLSPATASRVAAVVVFGDPYEYQPITNIDESRVDTFCFSTDLICKDTIFAGASHLAYSIDAEPAAEFVAGLVSV